MPRSIQADPYMTGKFHVVDSENFLTVQGSFSNVTLPEVTLNVAEYKEGNQRYKRKFPGSPEFGDIDLQKGVFKKDSAIGDWILKAINGEEYRADLEILEYHHSDTENLEDFLTAKPSRRIRIFNAFPNRWKPGGDTDAQSDEVSLQEMTISCERFEVIEEA